MGCGGVSKLQPRKAGAVPPSRPQPPQQSELKIGSLVQVDLEDDSFGQSQTIIGAVVLSEKGLCEVRLTTGVLKTVKIERLTQMPAMSRYTDPASLQIILSTEDVILVRGLWLWSMAKSADALPQRFDPPPANHEVLPKRQDLPSEALFSLEESSSVKPSGQNQAPRPGELFGEDGTLKMDIVVVSYCWLSRDHPDPQGEQLRGHLATAIVRFQVVEKGDLKKNTEFAVFFDWCSLYQKDRSPKQKAAFSRSLASINAWYGHRRTHKWLLTTLPKGMDASIKQYVDRGWTTFEAAISTMITAATQVVDCGRLPLLPETQAEADHQVRTMYIDSSENSRYTWRSPDEPEFEDARAKLLQRAVCRVRLIPICKPDKFREQLQSKHFTCGLEDFNLVAGLYEDIFQDMAQSTALDYSSMSLDEDLLTNLFDVLGQFRQLKILSLRECNIVVLPGNIGSLQGLEELDLQGNPDLPSLPERVGDLVHLRKLNLHSCSDLTTLPECISNLVNLRSLDVSGSSKEKRKKKFRTLPTQIGDLVNLVELNLSRSQLTSLPDRICKLINLKQIKLENCWNLTTLPESFGELVSLTYINMRSCKLTSVPESIGMQVNLTEVDISANVLTTLPESIGKLVSLTEINIWGNMLATLPHSIGKLVSLTWINLWDNRLATLPDSFSHLSNLTNINVGGDNNNLTTLPDSFGDLVNLSEIDFGAFKSSTFPESICKLVKLTEICINQSLFTTLPESLGHLVNLTKIDMASCNKLATLPESMGKLINLTEINMGSCRKLATLPESIGQLGDLRKIQMSCCDELATLPESIGKLVKLEAIDMRGCQTLATLPESMGKLVNLERIQMGGCKDTVVQQMRGFKLERACIDLH